MELETVLLELCVKEIEEQHGPCRTEEDYQRLSSAILQKTDMLLTPHILQRVFVAVRNHAQELPPHQVKNTLAKFVGYKGWEHYRLQHSPESLFSRHFRKFDVPTADDYKRKRSLSYTWLLVIAIAAALMAVTIKLLFA
jgi:hypothetical protein